MPQIRKNTKTKQKMLRAFWQLYQEKSLNQITVREIIGRADCNRSTFYAYFADMYDLLDQFEELLLPDLTQPAIQKIIAEEDISLSVQHCMALYQEYQEYYRVLLGENGDPAFRGKLTQILDQMIKAHLGQPEGQSSFEVDYLVETTAAILLTTLIFYFRRSDRPKAAEIIALLTKVLNQGVAQQLDWHLSCPGETSR